MIYDNFTPRANRALVLAGQEAARLGHLFVGTEHVLLGLIKLGEGVAFDVLKSMGLDLASVPVTVEEQIGPGPDQDVMRTRSFTPRVQKVLLLAAEEAKALNHTYVGTEHILLGLLRNGDGAAALLLKDMGIGAGQTRQEILRGLDANPPQYGGGREKKDGIALSWENPTGFSADGVGIPVGRLGHFTPRATQVLILARKEASRLKHDFIGTEHVLLGLIGLGQGVGCNVLKNNGLELENTRQSVEKQVGIGPGQKMAGNITFVPRVIEVLTFAQEEAGSLGHSYIGTEHILLGLLRDGDGPAACVLRTFNVDVDQTRKEVLKGMNVGFSPGDEAQREPEP
jgi:ATP-dependent Clp protease ATP-binding subunit ClpA